MINSKLQLSQEEYLQDMDKYIAELKKLKGPDGAAAAKKSLFRSGVTTRSGRMKKKIVSWD